MKRLHLLLFVSLSLLTACSDSDSAKDNTPSEQKPSGTEQPPSGEHKPTEFCTIHSFQPDSSWKSGDHTVQRYNERGIGYISIDGDEAEIDDDTLLWHWSKDHEGYRQKFRYDCDCDGCVLHLSDYYLETATAGYPHEMKLEWQDKATVPVERTLTTVSIPSELHGKYYTKDDSYDFETLWITDQDQVIYNASITSLITLDVVGKVSETVWIVRKSHSLNYQPEAFSDNGNWFSVIRIVYDDSKHTCIKGEGDGSNYITFEISDKWSHYRTIAVESANYGDPQELVSTDFDICKETVIPANKALEGKWYDASGKEWNIDFTNGTTTPYDDARKLNYTETLSNSDTETVALFTYGRFTGSLSDPTRYDNLYMHSIRFTKSGDACYDLVHSLDGEGVFSATKTDEILSNAKKTDKICRTEPKPQYKEYVKDETHYVRVSDSALFIQNGDDVFMDGKIVSSTHNDSAGTSYFDDLLLLVDGENVAEPYFACKGKYSYLRLFYYPEGSGEDTRSYLNVMYPRSTAFTCFDTREDAETGTKPAFGNSIRNYYEQVSEE